MGHVSLDEALSYLALVALRDRDRAGRMAARWLTRWLAETEAPTIDEAAMIAASLTALGGEGHAPALAALVAVSAGARIPTAKSHGLRLK